MGNQFTLKVYNHSADEITFKLTNRGCMYLPEKNEIKVPQYSWGTFGGALEIKNDFKTACWQKDSKFNVSAYRGKTLLGHTTYSASTTLERMFFSSGPLMLNGMAVQNREMNGPLDHNLKFERVDSYGDLFFNGRGVYVENGIKAGVHASSIGEGGYSDVDKMLGTALVNNNQWYDPANVDDNALLSIIAGWVSVVKKGWELYSLKKLVAYGPKDGKPISEQQKDRFLSLFSNYFQGYQMAVARSTEITVHCCGENDAPALHLLFTDTTAKAEEIITGNFYLPSPDSNNTFYENILHLSEEEAAEAARKNRIRMSGTLKPGEYLEPGDELLAQNQRYVLRYLKDGNLELFDQNSKKAVWDTGTGDKGAWRCVMQDDGNFVVYAKEGEAVWDTKLGGSQFAGSKLVLQDDGAFEIIDLNGVKVWNMWVGQKLPDTLKPGEFLLPGEKLVAENKRWVLRYQEDGNLEIINTRTNGVRWDTGTGGRGAWRCVMEIFPPNLVVYAKEGEAVWSSKNHHSISHFRLVLTDMGDLNLVDTSGQYVYQLTHYGR